LAVRGFITGLTPGKHGIHVHEKANDKWAPGTGSCTDAGGHWNPAKDPKPDHGSIRPDDIPKDGKVAPSHIGCLSNINADKKGNAVVKVNSGGIANFADIHLKMSMKDAKDAKYPIGKSLVIHADEDDLGRGVGDKEVGSKASGNAGARVACCQIKLAPVESIPEGGRCDSSVKANPGG